jgi:Tfp pilus assembly protein PilF
LILSNWHTKGNYYALNNDYKNAIKYFKKAIEESPNDKIAYMNLATIYFNQGNTSKGMKYHKKANSLIK